MFSLIRKSKLASNRFFRRKKQNFDFKYVMHLLGIDEHLCNTDRYFSTVVGVSGALFFEYLRLGIMYYGELDKDYVFICNKKIKEVIIICRSTFRVEDKTGFETESDVVETIEKFCDAKGIGNEKG